MSTPASQPVGLICGGGALPFAAADALIARGVQPVLMALNGFADAQRVAHYRHHWVAIGQFGRNVSLLRNEGCREVVFIGSLVRPSLKDVRFDLKTLFVLPKIIAAFRGGDDHLLTHIARIFEDEGFVMRGLHEIVPEFLLPQGHLTNIAPDESACADIAKGLAALASMAPHDIGQAVVVIDRNIVAVEGIEGTDAMLARVANLRKEGRLRSQTGRGVLVKAPKTQQDLRFDMPSLGPRTIEHVAQAGLVGLAAIAGHTLLVESQTTIALADRARLFFEGVDAVALSSTNPS